MPANINFNQARQTYSFASAKEIPWHKLGQVVPNVMTSREAIELANLDFQVGKMKIFGQYPEEDRIKLEKKGIEIYNNFATYRRDTGHPFGLVKGRYEVVQNSEAFDFFDAIVGEGKAIYETAGALGDGEKVFITAKLPYTFRIKGIDEIDNYILLTMTHDGSGAIEAMVTHIRVVCANTLAAALNSGRNKVKMKHTKNVHEKLQIAHKIMGISSTILEKNEQLFNELCNININDQQANLYFYNLMLNDGQLEQLAKQDYRVDYVDDSIISTKTKNNINKLKEYNVIGPGQDLSTTKGTLFGAYNAVAGYIQNVKEYKDDERKMESIIYGTEYNFNQDALITAIKMFGNPELLTVLQS